MVRRSWWVRAATGVVWAVGVGGAGIAPGVPGPAVAASTAGVEADPSAALTVDRVDERGQAEEDAARKALASGQREEVAGTRDAFSQTFANSDGLTFTQETSATPRFGRDADGRWTDLRTTLTPRGGRWVPEAPAAAVSFSGGGVDAPLVTIGDGRGSLSLWLSGPLKDAVDLKAPERAGDDSSSVIYGDVLPDVDLRLTATADGYRQVFVVRSREGARRIAPYQLDFAWRGQGLRLVKDPRGGVQAVGADGQVALSAPAALMWNSLKDPVSSSGAAQSVGASGAAVAQSEAVTGSPEKLVGPPEWQVPGPGADTAVMPVEVTDTTMSLTPQAELLNTRDERAFPIYLDPLVGLEQPRRLVLSSQPRFTPLYQFDEEGVGLCREDPHCKAPHVKRMFFEFTAGSAAKKRILTTIFKAYQTWSWTCDPYTVDLHLANKRLSKGLAWKTRPMDVQRLASKKVAHGRGSLCKNDGARWVSLQSKTLNGAVRELASGKRSYLTLMLRARNEQSEDAWKRFRSDAVIQVIYANNPLVPDPVGVKNPAWVNPRCSAADSTAQPAMTVGVAQPVLSARMKAYPAEESQTRAVFQVQRKPIGTRWADAGQDVFTQTKPAGTAWDIAGNTQTLDDRTLAAGYVYRMHAATVSRWSYSINGERKNGTLTSAYSPWCYFRIDTAAPRIPTVTSQGLYVEKKVGQDFVEAGGPGVPGAFTFTANAADKDVAEFFYRVVNLAPATEKALETGTPKPPVPATKNPRAAGASATVSITPVWYGKVDLEVWASDGTHEGERYVFTFWVKQPSEPVGLWHFDDAPGATRAVDAAVEGTARHDLVLGGVSPSTGARLDSRARRPEARADQGLALDGQGAFAQTQRAVPSGQGSFTVSAWVYRTGATSGTVLSQTSTDTSRSGWALAYVAEQDRWVMSWGASTATPLSATSTQTGTAPPARTWTHVAGVVDADAQGGATIRLYVNGRPVGETVSIASVYRRSSAPGNLQVGRAGRNGVFDGYFTGMVDEVQVWQRALGEREIARDAEAMVSDPSGDRDRYTALVGDWQFSEALPAEGQTRVTQVADSSAYHRGTVTLSSGGAQIQALTTTGVHETDEDWDVPDEASTEEPQLDGPEGKDSLTLPEATDLMEQALVLDGTSGYASAPGPVVAETASFTVAVTVRLDPAVSQGKVGDRFQVLSQRAGATSPESSWGLWWETTPSSEGRAMGLWCFGSLAVPTTENDAPAACTLPQEVPQESVSVFGIHDALAQQVEVQAAGNPPGVADYVRSSGADGEFSVGRARRAGAWTDFLRGQVSRLRVWVGAMNDNQVSKVEGA